MAEADTSSCRCSNISIMQLFHQLKQRFPNVPDQIVSKVIQQNYHDRVTCETLLQRENALYSVQSYPGAIISGRGSEVVDVEHFPTTKCPHIHGETTRTDAASSTTSSSRQSRDRSSSISSSPRERDTSSIESENVSPPKTSPSETSSEARPRTLSLEERMQLCKLPLGQLVREAHMRVARRASCESRDESLDQKTVSQQNESLDISSHNEPVEDTLNESSNASSSDLPKFCEEQSEPLSVPRKDPPVRPTSLACDIPPPLGHFPSHPKVEPSRIPQTAPSKRSAVSSPNSLAAPNALHFIPSSPTGRLLTPSSEIHGSRPHRLNESFSHASSSASKPQEYEVAVECVVTPGTPGDQQRSFTSVNLTLRPPSVETTLPIDICSGQSLTYTSASFDPRQGYQSHLQIRIGPVLLQHQRERKDLLARELWKKKERLRAMQSQVQSIKMALARAAMTPLLLSKLKADMEQLRGECERLTAAVDAYSQPNQRPEQIPLGPGWNCRICTFRNHPLLSVCEECEMPRLSIGSPSAVSVQHPHRVLSSHPSVFPNNNVNNPSCAGGETSTSASRTITPIQER